MINDEENINITHVENLNPKLSSEIYKRILETYVKLETVISKEILFNNGLWTIPNDEKWKLMTVITAWELGMGIIMHYFPNKKGQQQMILDIIDGDTREWLAIRKIPVEMLLKLNEYEEPLLAELRVYEIMKEIFLVYTRASDGTKILEGDIVDTTYSSHVLMGNILQILGMGIGLKHLFIAEKIFERCSKNLD